MISVYDKTNKTNNYPAHHLIEMCCSQTCISSKDNIKIDSICLVFSMILSETDYITSFRDMWCSSRMWFRIFERIQCTVSLNLKWEHCTPLRLIRIWLMFNNQIVVSVTCSLLEYQLSILFCKWILSTFIFLIIIPLNYSIEINYWMLAFICL